MKIIDVQELQRIKEDLKRFRSSLPQNPSDTCLKIACFSDRNRPDIKEIFWAHFLNQMNLLLVKLEEQDDWKVINGVLLLINTNRWEICRIILQLFSLNRFEEISQICRLVEQNRWRDISLVDSLAQQNRFQEVTCYLNDIFNSQPLANNAIASFELKNLIDYTKSAGLTVKQAQSINDAYGKSLIETEKIRNQELNKVQIEIYKNQEFNNERLRYERESGAREDFVPLENNGIRNIDYLELERQYISANRLVRLSTLESFDIYKWDRKTGRYTKVDSNTTLTTDINSYAYQVYGSGIEVNTGKLNSMANRMRHNTIPLLGESQTVESNESQIFFKNGYYDLKERKFNFGETYQYFHTSTIPIDYDENASEPEIFNTMLTRIFDSDKAKIKLAYQIIGAIISDVTLKYIYVFQGKSHGGKSTLAECIVRLLNEDEVEFKGSINELDEGKARSFENRIKLLSIDDSPSDKWNGATISYLKTRSRGVSSKKLRAFKILLNTNYSIGFKTENGRDESIENRIIILPFEKDMNMANKNEYTSDEEKLMTEKINNYLDSWIDREKSGIIKKSISEFQEVLESNKEFVCRYPLNGVCNSLPEFTLPRSNEDLKSLLEKVFEFTTGDEYTKAEDILNYLNQEIQNGRLKESGMFPFTRTNEVGKLLKSIWSERIKDKRISDKTYYNLKFKDDK